MGEKTLNNEADVREEIAAPFLMSLGYKKGSENDIDREHLLRYDALQLGRKKTKDIPLGGKADYLLTVAGAGRWILETKPPHEDIDTDTIDQTISYARHPEVCAHYAAILNGRRFVLYDQTKSSNDAPLLDIEVTTGEALAEKLEAILSPASVRRDCGPPIVDLGRGLATGFRSAANIIGGEMTHVSNHWDIPSSIPPEVAHGFSQDTQRLVGYVAQVSGGQIWRDNTSRIRAKIKWGLPHEELRHFVDATKFESMEYLCLDSIISSDPERPSVFELVGNLRVEEGLPLFNVIQWRTQLAQIPLDIALLCQATGYLKDDHFAGIAIMQQVMHLPGTPDPVIFNSQLKFSIKVDAR